LICGSALSFQGVYDCLLPLFLFLIILVNCLDFIKEMRKKYNGVVATVFVSYTFDNKLYILTKVYYAIWATNLQYRKKY
jgi:hypothetical protein